MATTEVEPRRSQYTWRDKLGHWDVKASPYLYIAPFFIVFGLTGLFPIIYTAVISFMDWDTIRNTGEYLGWDNFQFVLNDRQFWIALRNTFSIFLLSSVPQVIIATFIAAMLDHNLRARTFWRMGVLVPYVMMPVAVALIFSQLFADTYGLINHWLGFIGINPIQWHVDVIPSHLAIASMVNFRWIGYNALILLAAMQAIPRELYEAAAIDGAGKTRRFFSVTLPQIRPTAIFVIITSTIGGLQIFDEPRMFDTTGTGGADKQWLTITMYMYNTGWGQLNFGRAAAIAWLLFLIILAFGLLNFWLTRRLISSDTSGSK
ncbi:carbohydrate ABC transporter permease [Demequina sp. NBRC 110055]|uniref:carbohydrate ABC transporter permease n=1 Tax=Demequina sp. NBRC 110055 TaxID=1570344 RepID=UPI000A031767|nr:sugar ABC transporter permease [Demequina sp. NBRC 110055]